MNKDHLDYRDVLNRSARELSELMETLEELEDIREKYTQRVSHLRDLIFALSNVIGEDPFTTRPELFPELIEPETGFTDAIREVLKSSDRYLSPVDIRDALKERRFNLDKYKNPLAGIHQILRRLEEAQEIEIHPEGKKLYRWKKQSGMTWIRQDAGGNPPSFSLRSENSDLLRMMAEDAIEAEKNAIDAVKKGRVLSPRAPKGEKK